VFIAGGRNGVLNGWSFTGGSSGAGRCSVGCDDRERRRKAQGERRRVEENSVIRRRALVVNPAV
jgi:hypothetical protein